MLSRCSFVTLFFFLNLPVSAQDISGVWVGNYKPSLFTTTPEKLVVEIFLYNDSLITGASHLYYKHDQFEHYKIYGRFRKKDSIIYFSEDSTIAVKLGFMEENCLGNYTMKLTSTGKLLEMKFDEDIKQTNSQPTDKNLERKSDIQSLVEISNTEKDSILIELYDNGVIDNASASVYLDDSLLLH